MRVTEHNSPHRYSRGHRKADARIAVWPRGRFMGLKADDRRKFTMVGVMPKGHTLKINALTSRIGGVRVEACR